MRKFGFVIAAALCLGACATSALVWEGDGPPAQVLATFGLIGHLAADCEAPVGPGHVLFEAQADGTVEVLGFLSAGFGMQAQRPTRTVIERARMVGPNTLQAYTKANVRGGDHVFTKWVREEDAYKLMESVREDGHVFFTNGVDGGYGYKWVRKCAA